jgi:hypothetical protein
VGQEGILVHNGGQDIKDWKRLCKLNDIDPRDNKQDFHDWKRDLGIPNDNTDKNVILKYLEELLGHPPKK